MDMADGARLVARAPARAAAVSRRLEDQAAYVLHMYPYSETSMIVESFTRAHGRVPLLAKGAKRPGSAMRGVLMQFQKVGLSWSGKGDLRTLTRSEWLGGIPALGQTALFCGFYLNELLLKLLARDDPHERLFDCYERALIELARGAREAQVLRVFEKQLLREIGYAVNLRVDAVSGEAVDPQSRYAYMPDAGLRLLRPGESAERELSGKVALAIDRNDYSEAHTALHAKQLMRSLIELHLNGRKIATRQIFFELQQS